MAERRPASTHRQVQHLQQQNRARRLVALVPKAGAKSDIDSSDESSSDELCNINTTHSYSSSLPPSLPSSLENLNLLDSDDDSDEVIHSEIDATQPSPHHPSPSISGKVSTPPNQTSKRLPSQALTDKSSSRRTPASSQNINPLINTSRPVHSPLAREISVQPSSPASPFSHWVPTPLASTSAYSVPFPLASTSSYGAPSPATFTRSKKNKTIIKKKTVKPKKLTIKWTCQQFTSKAQVEDEREFLNEEKSPIEYFKQFFSDEMISMIVHQTNLYSTQSINLTEGDVRDFIAINLLMGIVNMPAYTDYWSNQLRYEKVSNIMSLKKFQMIRRYIHFYDNLHDDGDRYYKIRPLLQAFRDNCLQIEEETRFSIDEMMVPYKGTRAGNRKQYVKNKPKKWGFKIFVRAGVSGLVYDLLVYGGEDTFRYHNFTDVEESMGLGAKVVIALAKTIHEPACKILFFDNFFTSIELITHLRNEYGIFSLGTIRQNRLRGAEKKLPTDKNLKKRGRGSHAQVVCNKNKVVVLKWYDNKCVTAASTYMDSFPVETTLRFSKQTRNKVPVPCPRMVKEYNSNMGGVDLADMLVALYRTDLRGHRWYLPLFSQVLDISVNNAWLLYRRGNQGNNKLMKLKNFKYELYKSLLLFERTDMRKKNDSPVVTRIIKNPVAERPLDAIRYDKVGHIPQFTTKGRCRYCSKGQTKFICQKCNVRLCLVENRNCYHAYHLK